MRSILYRLALFVLVVSFPLWLRPSDRPYLDVVLRGDTHADRGERSAAVGAYLEATAILPGEPDTYVRLARSYLDWGRTPAAERALLQAQLAGASDADVARLRVATAAQRGAWATVVRLAVPLLDTFPADRSLQHTLATAYLELRAWDAAEFQYGLLVGLDPGDTLAQERLGILTLGKLDAPRHLALADTELAARILDVLADPRAAQDPNALHLAVGRVLLDAEEWPLAAREFERVLHVNQGPPDAYATLGFVLDQMGYVDDAQGVLELAVNLAPESALAHTLLGVHHDLLGYVRAARAEYETAYDLDPENAALCVEIGGTWVAERQYTVAAVWTDEAARLAPENAEVWQALASFYLNGVLDVEGHGVAAAERAVELAPDDPATHELLGRVRLELGAYDVAEGELRRALALDPGRVAAQYYLAQVLEAQGRRVDAGEAFARAPDLDVAGQCCVLLSRAMMREPVPGAFDCPETSTQRR